MIDFYYWPTPNGQKVALFLEETGIDYEIHPVDIGKGDQFKPDFLKISPNNKMPAIVDRAPPDGGDPVSVFESGAILLYLADKTKKLIPNDLRGRVMALQWLFWQVGGLGPMAGQNHHFNRYAPEKIPYAIDRYGRESKRLFGVLDKHLEGRAFICGDEYTIADIASYPWIVSGEAREADLATFPNLARWTESIKARPATERAYARGEKIRPSGQKIGDEERRILFGQRKAG
jgi:GST-like protein